MGLVNPWCIFLVFVMLGKLGVMAITTSIPEIDTHSVGEDEEYINSSCRDGVASGNYSRKFQLLTSETSHLDRFQSLMHLNGSNSEVVAMRSDVCPGKISLCNEGFTVSIWLQPDDTVVDEEAAYYLSSGAQRAESCGFYLRLVSVISDLDDGSRIGVFDVGVAVSEAIWQVRYQAAMSVKSHVMMMWSSHLGLDVYVDGVCAGVQAAGNAYVRDPVASCSADPFEDLYVGRRNDMNSGYAVGYVGQLTIWDAWMKPADVYSPTDEGVLRAYYEDCLPRAPISSTLQTLPDSSFVNISSMPMPEKCRAACHASGFQYAAVGGDGPTCYCLADYTNTQHSFPEGSCDVCMGYTEITCGSSARVSLYRLTSFQNAIPPQEAVTGLSVALDGVELADGNYTVSTQRNVNVSFSINSGEDVFYSIYGDSQVEYIQTYDTYISLLFPEPRLYHMTVEAANDFSRIERAIWVSAENDTMGLGSLLLEMTSDGLAAVSESIAIWLETANGSPGIDCILDYGDGTMETFQPVLSSMNFTHQYDNSGVFLIVAACGEAGLYTVNSSNVITIQERVTFTHNTTFRVPKGTNLLIPFEVTGTNITSIAVVFDGTPSITNYTCSTNFICEGYVGYEMMNVSGTHVFEIRASNLISGLVSSRADVYVGVTVNHFSYEINATVITPNQWVQLSASITEGTHAYFAFHFDGSSMIYPCLIAPCTFSHSKYFPKAGVFDASVEVSNDFNAFTSEIYSVGVYNAVPELSADVINSTSTEDPVKILIHPASNTSLWPTNATAAFVIPGFQGLQESFVPSSESEDEFTLFLLIPVYGSFVVNINVSNAVSSVALHVVTRVGEYITGLFAGLPTETQATGDSLSLEFGFSTGSEAVIIIEFGDGINETVTALNASTSETIQHAYATAGNYTIVVRARNAFGEEIRELSVRIVNPIDGLQIGTYGTNIATGIPVQFVFYLRRSVVTPQFVRCFVDYGDGSEIDAWEGSLLDVVNITRNHAFLNPGLRHIRANCENEVSQVTLSLNMTIYEPVTECLVSSDVQVATTNTTIKYHAWVSNGSSVDFRIHFGDGSDAQASDITESHEFEHAYNQAGLYIFHLMASNPVSYCETDDTPVIIQDPIHGDDYNLLIRPAAVDVTNQTTLFRIFLKEDALIPTNVTARWSFGDGNSSTQLLSAGTRTWDVVHIYKSRPGTYQVTVYLSNLVSEVDLNGTLEVLEPIRDIDYNISTTGAVGEDLTLSILAASGSSLSYTIDFGDGAVITRFQEEPDILDVIHSYDQVGTYILTIRVENKLGTFFYNHTEIRIVYPVQGLHFEASDEVLYTPGDVSFSLSIDDEVPPPTMMECIWQRVSVGNMYIHEELMRLQNVTLPPGRSLNATFHFSGGQFTVRVVCRNILGKQILWKVVTAYEVIEDLAIVTHDLIAEVGYQVGTTVSTSKGSLLNYVMHCGDGQIQTRYVVLSQNTKSQHFICVYPTLGLYTPSVTAGNVLGQLSATLNHSIEILYSTRGLQFSSDVPVTLSNTLVTFRLAPMPGMTPPSTSHLLWCFGDGTCKDEIIHFNMTHGITSTHSYDAPDTYHPTVTVTNNLDSHTYNTTIVINEEPVQVHVSFEYIDGDDSRQSGLGPKSNWFLTGSDIELRANSTLQNATVLWLLGDGETSSDDIVHKQYDAPGSYNITLKVVREDKTYADVWCVVHLVKPFHLSSIQAVNNETGGLVLESGKQVDLTLLGSGFDGPLCISWDRGDLNQQAVYGTDCQMMSGNNSILRHSDQESGLNISYTYSLPGHYHINVSVSTFYTTAYISKDVTIIGCWTPPQVTLEGPTGTMTSPYTLTASESIQLKAVSSLNCLGIASTLTWQAYQLKTNESRNTTERVTHNIQTLITDAKIDLVPGSLEVGLYEFVITMKVDGRENLSSDRSYLRVEHSPLVLVLEGGSSRAVGNVHPLVLDAATSSQDPDESAGPPSSWLFKWSCSRVSGSSTVPDANSTMPPVDYLCDNSTWEVLNVTEATIQLDPQRLRAGEMYVFKAEASVGSRQASIEQTVVVVQGEPPQVSIRCVSNCRSKTNPTSSFTLQGTCQNCDSLLGVSLFTWSLYLKQENGEFEVVGDLGSMTSTGVTKQGIAFHPNQLEAGREYRLRLDVQDAVLGDGFTQYSFLTNLPPYNGSCTIAPAIGYAITSEFSVVCTGWLDEGYAVDRSSISEQLAAAQILQYQVRSRPSGETSYSLTTSSTESSITGLIFGLGPEEFDYVHEVQIGVIDVYGASSYIDLMVKVKKPSLTSDDITSLVSSNGSSLSLLVSSGNVEGATQLISAVLSVVSDHNENSSLTVEEVTELRSNLVLEIGRISIWARTAESLLQASSVMSLSLTGGVNDQILMDAAATMAMMAMRLEGLDTEDQEVIIDTAGGLASGLGSLIAQSDIIVQNSLGATQTTTMSTPSAMGTSEPAAFDAYGDDLSPDDAEQMTAQTEAESQKHEEESRLVARTISTLAQETLGLVSEVLLSQRVSGQPPITLVTDKLTVEVFKDEPHSLAERMIEASAGSFQLPNASSLFGNSAVKQVQQVVYSYNSNPFGFSESSDSIGSKGVLSLELSTGEGSPISVSNLTEDISIFLEVDQSILESAERFMVSFKNASTLSYRKVNITDDSDELRVTLKEISDNSTSFLVYLRKGNRPNETAFDAVMEIPRALGQDEEWSDEGLMTEARYTAVFTPEVLDGVGEYYLAFALADDWNAGAINQTDSLDGVNATLVMFATGCRYWDANSSAWSSYGCQVGPRTSSRSTHCLCNHLSSFAASFFVPPNTIDFSTVISKFLDLKDNAAVFSTVLGFLGLYLILLVWLRRKDKQDIIKWGVSPLADNHPSDSYFYQVTVQTGMGPGCGTRSKVSVVLTGEDGDSGVRLLDDEKRKVFERGSICHFLMGVAQPLGPLSYIRVWHDNSGSGQLASWYLSQVSITDLQNGQQFFFMCDRWLAVEKDDGAIERVIPVASRLDLVRFRQLFYSSSRRNLFDDHIWFSLFSRPTRSSFTRVQRLSCCLCLLYLSMIANAMFYRTEETVENPTALRLGPFIFTLQQVFIGFISALVVIPVNVIIVQIFRKSKMSSSQLTGLLPKHVQIKLDDLKNGKVETPTPQSSVVDLTSDETKLVPAGSSSKGRAKDQKEPFLLPHWCVYVAWLLMITSSFTAAFFTVLYSLEWGHEKSCEWLTAMLMSLFNSVIIIQPFKVVAVAIIVSLIFKKPSKMDVEMDGEFSKDQNQLHEDEELLHNPNISKQAAKYQVKSPPSEEALKEAREKRLKEIKMNHILRESWIFTIFVALVLFLCYSNRDEMAFYMSESLRNIFLTNNGADNTTNKLTFSSLEKSTPDLFWAWVETALIPGLYSSMKYNGDPMHWRHTRFISDWQGYRVGPVRLRQLRVKNESCKVSRDISRMHSECHLAYSWTNQEESDFTVAWKPLDSHPVPLYSDVDKAPWIYRDYLDLNGVPHPSILAVYSGGGYVAEFGTSTSSALSTAKFLGDTGWYDELTRAIFVEFSVFNANINLFSVATLLIETPPTGGAHLMCNIHTFRLYHYDGPLAIITIILQIIFVAYLIFFVVKLILEVKKAGLKRLKNFWVAIELAIVMVAIAAIVMFAFRQVFIEVALQEVKNKNQDEFVNFSHIAKWDELFGYLMACVAFLSVIRYMRLLRLNARMSLLGMTLGYASKDIFYFAIMWSLVFSAFVQLSYFLFHTAVGTFSSLVSTSETLFSMLLGKFDFDAMIEANRMLGGAVFLIYILTMYMILTNMFITIVVEAFTKMRTGDDQNNAADPEMVEYMIDKFKAFFVKPLQGKAGQITQKMPQADQTYKGNMESLDELVDKIVDFVEGNYGKIDDLPTDLTEGRDSPARTLSRISLHPVATSPTGSKKSPKKTQKRRILIA